MTVKIVGTRVHSESSAASGGLLSFARSRTTDQAANDPHGHVCPHCDTVISIQKNPFAINEEAMHEISRSSSVILTTLVQEVAVLRAEIELLEHLVTEKMQR